MDKTQTLNSVEIRFMQLTRPGLYMPGPVNITLFNDNKSFKSVGEIRTKISPKKSQLRFEPNHFELWEQQARYIRVVAPNTIMESCSQIKLWSIERQ